jgi:hypothetical protein
VGRAPDSAAPVISLAQARRALRQAEEERLLYALLASGGALARPPVWAALSEALARLPAAQLEAAREVLLQLREGLALAPGQPPDSP